MDHLSILVNNVFGEILLHFGNNLPITRNKFCDEIPSNLYKFLLLQNFNIPKNKFSVEIPSNLYKYLLFKTIYIDLLTLLQCIICSIYFLYWLSYNNFS